MSRIHDKSLSPRSGCKCSSRAHSILILLASVGTPAYATWSIVVVDTKTREVAVGSATCLTNFDLEAGLPMVLVDVGAGAAQGLVDNGAVNRKIIRSQMLQGRSPERIIDMISQTDFQFQGRQFGIVDFRGRSATFVGAAAGQYKGGATGTSGDLAYSIQGNVLTGAPVLQMAESALVNTPGDLPEKLMAAMEAARAMGGDGRCSCSVANPTLCGSPPDFFEKSADVGFMIVTRAGDIDGTCTSAAGCANGDYFMNFNVPFQDPSAEDPVFQLRAAFDAWRTSNAGRPDAVQSVVTIEPSEFSAGTGGMATMTIHLRDWQGSSVDGSTMALSVEHDAQSAGLSAIGSIGKVAQDSYEVKLTVPPQIGRDLFRIVVDDSVRPVVLLPLPSIHVYARTDTDHDDDVDLNDSTVFLNCMSGPGVLPESPCDNRDTDDDGDVDLRDAARHQLEFTAPPCGDLFIDTHPESQLVRCGLSFTLSVIVDADPPAQYQWFHDGLPIPGATDLSYSVAVAGATDLGEYFVRVSNSCGAVFSNTAILAPRGECP